MRRMWLIESAVATPSSIHFKANESIYMNSESEKKCLNSDTHADAVVTEHAKMIEFLLAWDGNDEDHMRDHHTALLALITLGLKVDDESKK